jgi:Tol biopolymer transport system component
MTIANGTRLGPYEILGPLGAGGMGEVYRARDNRLDRVVAIKLLPDAFAADPERLARFEREAKLLASLHHPNIAVIHGLEEDAGRRFIAMEHVEGSSLAQRLESGPLPVDEALDVARQVATALEAAHEGGVVHRDLKPGNIMLTPSGTAKVLDFGLAKGVAGSPSDVSLSASPTMTYAATAAGAVLGTAAYMSPEQARGKPVDRRTDIWAFGCVLFECLTGRQVFEGETVSDLIASILKGGIEWEALPADTPQRVRELLRRCLERDPRQRLRDIGEARLMLEQPHAAPQAAAAAGVPLDGRRGWPAPLALGLALALAALAAAAAWVLRPVPAPPTSWTDLAPPSGQRFDGRYGGHMALSPDSRWLAMVVLDTVGTARIAVRDFQTGGTKVVAGTEGALYPFWSPDSRSLGYFTPGRMLRLDVDGGAITTLAPAAEGRGGAWNREGQIVFAPTSTGGLSLVSANGGDVRVLIPDSLRGGYRFPHFLPDGRHFAVGYFESLTTVAVEVRSLAGGEVRQVPLGGNISGNVHYADGLLFYQQERSLRARPFDPARVAFTGEAMTLASDISFAGPRARADYTVAPGGAVVFRPGQEGTLDQLVVRDRGGRLLARVDAKGSAEDLALSPDGRSVVWALNSSTAGQGADLWVYDFDRETSVRLTFGGRDDDPVWSPDGRRIAWMGAGGIRVKAANGAGDESVLLDNARDMLPTQWTSDGRSILFVVSSGRLSNDAVHLLDIPSGKSSPLLEREVGHVRWGQVSPDGRWIVYASNESGLFQVYVQDYPALRGRWQVSSRGGGAPRWRRDGRELYFLDYDSGLNAVSVTPMDSSLALGNPELLFSPDMGAHSSNRNFSWDVDAAGERFFTLEPIASQTQRATVVVARHWRPTGGK